jgi:hypothetical protein
VRSYINLRFFVVAVLQIKSKQQHGKTKTKTLVCLYCMYFFDVRTKNKQNIKSSFFVCFSLVRKVKDNAKQLGSRLESGKKDPNWLVLNKK